MSTLLYSLGRWSYRHGVRVLLAWIIVLVAAGGGAALFSQGTDNSFSIPGTESQEGLQQLSRTFPQVSGTSAQIIVVAAPGDRVDAAPYSADIATTITDLRAVEGVLAVTDPFDQTVSGLVSDDGDAAIIRLQFDGQSGDVSPEAKASLTDVSNALGVELPEGSQVALGGDLFGTSIPGVTITEAVGLIIALLVLIVTFRSFVVAGLPLLTAVIGVGLSMALIFVATAFASISSTTPLLALMLGLAVGIDYALFIAARHQDQVREGVDPEESAARATGTAGSAVVFAGVTVLIALIGLSFAGIPFLTTMGIAASVAVAIAVLVAVTLTPAMLGLVKGRIIGRPRRRKKGADAAAHAPKRINAWVRVVSTHPIAATVSVVAVLGVLAIPASSLALALPNAGMLPESNQARQNYDLAAEYFGPGVNGPLVMTGTIVTSNDPVTLMNDIAGEIDDLPGVERIALATPNETADTGIVQIVPSTAPDDPATADLVRELRAQHDRLLDEYGIDLKVTGYTAVAIDISDRLSGALVPFAIFVVGLSFILLMIVFRSIAVPLTAALGYLLSVAAAFGVVAAVFEWGWFADLLHVTRVGPVISFMPIVLMGVLFGLAMDYQVFLVTRMREDYVHARARGAADADARATAIEAVRTGFSATARVVTAAALIMFAVFAAFVPEGDSSIKPIALGLAVGIAVDAFLVRMTLIPALMTLLGAKAWWIPRWLDRLLPSFDVEGEAVERERALRDWPAPGSTAVVAADGVGLESRDVDVFAGFTATVEPGGAIVLTSSDVRASRAALLAIAGRVPTTSGRLRVAGHLLPGRAAWVRGHVAVALLDDAADPLAELRGVFAGGPGLVALQGLDALAHGALRDQAAAMLRDAEGTWTLAISAADPHAARGVLDDAGWRDVQTVRVESHSSRSAELPEVNA
ncbi:RND superfamily putative drug exporter [Microbacterium sp. AG1240]|uniref:MMPL family transporter n=1 Tax=Microbacterium sp. AG1240 TaxID=2183992 RepID=UPI000EB47944|nr:MMPL family transporter [Microbacterium sp. AG1240]RKT33252.1 RND superfamily putative drug exporter [Microbacterium sp. AG1240]